MKISSKYIFKKIKELISSKDAGFTTIEILVVISVLTILSGILILYSRTSENQIALLKEQAKIVNTFIRARALASETFASEDTPKPCGYGVFLSLTGRSVTIFRDMPDLNTPDDCTSADKRFTEDDPEEVFEAFVLDERVSVDLGDTSFVEVIFIPPDPQTILNNGSLTDANIVITPIEGTGSLGVRINDAGQITAFQPQ